MVIFDPRTISSPVCEALQILRTGSDAAKLKDQKNQAVELYTYLSTWGMLRLKAEEQAISPNQEGKRQIVQRYFQCLEDLSGTANLIGNQGLNTLKGLSVDDYLSLTGLGLQIAEEFGFWATAIYHDVTGDN